jgi:hypothetical protein
MSYRLLVLPELDSMRPELLARLRQLVKAGGIILGPPPSRSPSLADYPQCDARVKKLADELWGQREEVNAASSLRTTQHATGKGRVFRSSELQLVLDELGIARDFGGADPKKILATHRTSREADIYFLSNQGEQATAITPVFRVSGKLPELWDAASGRVVKNRPQPVCGCHLSWGRVGHCLSCSVRRPTRCPLSCKQPGMAR